MSTSVVWLFDMHILVHVLVEFYGYTWSHIAGFCGQKPLSVTYLYGHEEGAIWRAHTARLTGKTAGIQRQKAFLWAKEVHAP